MFSSVVFEYIHTIIDTKYSKRTQETAKKYCDEVVKEFMNVFSSLNPEIISYLDKQTYAKYVPVTPIFNVSLYTDLFKPVVQSWVSKIISKKELDCVIKPTVITRITRLIYDNLYSKHPASKFSISEKSKLTPIYTAAERNEYEEELVNACSSETFKLLDFKSSIESGKITKYACIAYIEEHDNEFKLLKKYTVHIVDMIIDDTVVWLKNSKQTATATLKNVAVNPANESIKSVIDNIPKNVPMKNTTVTPLGNNHMKPKSIISPPVFENEYDDDESKDKRYPGMIEDDDDSKIDF